MTALLPDTIFPKTGGRVGQRRASIYRKIQPSYTETKRLNDLPKVTQSVPQEQKVGLLTLLGLLLPQNYCLLDRRISMVRFTLISAGALCL